MKAKLFDSSLIQETQDALDFIGNILESSTESSIIGKNLDGKRVVTFNRVRKTRNVSSPVSYLLRGAIHRANVCKEINIKPNAHLAWRPLKAVNHQNSFHELQPLWEN